jgi:type II secretory pathway pseudopilin PulG
LALLPTAYSPFLVEAIVRLGTRLPFAQAADEMTSLFGVSVSPDTVRRLTEEAGAVQLALEQQELARLEHDAPLEREGGAVQQMSADGAMVPVVGGSWTEVRTIAIGTIEKRNGEAHATELTYFTRRCTADAFIRQATLPTYERGTRGAGTVVAVMDGASWLQELIDEQCPDAVRILDFPHAVGYLNKAAQAAFGPGSREAAVWLDDWASKLKRDTPEEVLAAIRALPTPIPEAATVKRTVIRYLSSRMEQIRFAAFQAQGYPIGSGIVESAGKLVVEARLKGSGMHWSPTNLNPLLALRGRLCSGQWEQTWPVIYQAWRAQVVQARDARRSIRRIQRAAEEAARSVATTVSPPKRERTKTIIDGRPTDAHPWKDRWAGSAA